MVFLLRAAESPSRTLREIEEDGVERTFFLWRGGAWVSCLRLTNGDAFVSCSPDLTLDLEDGGSVLLVAVRSRPTVPSPAPPPVLPAES